METEVIREALGLKCDQIRDFLAERVLESLGVEFAYEFIDLRDIDRVESRKNRGRISGIDDGVAGEYAVSHKKGAKFPAICCRRTAKHKLTVAGGNTRLAAFEMCGETQCWAIVFESDDMMFHAIAAKLNEVPGVRTSNADRVRQAAELVRMYSYGTPEVADLLNVSAREVQKELKREEVKALLEAKFGAKREALDKLPRIVVDVISARQNTPAVANELAILAGKKGVTANDVREASNAVTSFTTEAERLEFLRGLLECKSKHRQNGNANHRPIYRSLISSIKKLEAILTRKKTAAECQIDTLELPELKARWRKLNELASSILNG